MRKPNAIQVSEHFALSEFEDRGDNNVVVLHPLLLERLEELHIELSKSLGREIAIHITCGTRTPRTNRRLAQLLGWTDEGGLVAQNSRHLPKHGGIAADLYVEDKEFGQLMPIAKVADIAAPFFDVVLNHYPTHIHVDLRYATKEDA